jgi:signal transduction histidine kinase
LDSGRVIEGLVYALLLAGISLPVFRGFAWAGIRPFTLAYLIFPIMIWVALRFGQVGSVTATFVVSIIAIWGTVVSFNPSGSNILSHRLLLLQSFMGITAITFMTMAAVVAEREFTLKRQHQLTQKAALLSKQRSRLMALNQAKDEFIGLASHQLRTPATSVKQYTGMLLDDYAGKLTKAQRDMLLIAYESNERQLQVVDSILRVAQVDTGNIVLKKEKVDLSLLVKEILSGQTPILAGKRQTVDFRPPRNHVVASVDKEKIRMVLENILDNASKYSPPGKKLEVKLQKTKSNLTISVKDDGVGIVQRDRRKLFKKFSRIDNPLSAAVGGTGLGLYWAKKIVDLHRGSIIVTSKPNRGSTFTISLPNA